MNQRDLGSAKARLTRGNAFLDLIYNSKSHLSVFGNLAVMQYGVAVKSLPKQVVFMLSYLSNYCFWGVPGEWGGEGCYSCDPHPGSRARIYIPFKEPRNRFPAWRAGTKTPFFGPSLQAT